MVDDMRGISRAAVTAREKWQVRKKTATRRHIRECAIALFMEQGYDQVTVRQIAEKSGVTTVTLFRHFPQKEDIILRMPQDLEFWNAVRQQLVEAARMDKDLISLFKHVVEGLRGKILPRDIGTVTRRLHLVLGNETLQNALYAKIPTWSSTVRHTLLNQPDSFEARLTASMLVEFSIELMLEWARRIESSERDKETLLWKTLEEMTDESRQPQFVSLFKSAPIA